VDIYEDSGRLMRPSWPGFRALVTDSEGQTSWVNMPEAGQETFTQVQLRPPFCFKFKDRQLQAVRGSAFVEQVPFDNAAESLTCSMMFVW
jgi:hypothetical protein